MKYFANYQKSFNQITNYESEKLHIIYIYRSSIFNYPSIIYIGILSINKYFNDTSYKKELKKIRKIQ